MLVANNFGLFVLATAQSNQKTFELPADQAQEIQNNLYEKISHRIEEIRTTQRRAEEDFSAITIF